MAALLPSLFLENFASTSLVADDETGELAGFIVGFDSADQRGESYVHFVGVRPDLRGTGLGRRLHDEFAHAAVRRGIDRITCVTSILNEASVAFHTAIGFTVVGIDEPVVVQGVDDVSGHVRMVRRLPGSDVDVFEPLADPRPTDQPWPQVSWSPDPNLELAGQWVTLRPTVLEDAAELREALSAAEVWAHIPGGPLVDDESCAAMIAATIDRGWFPWTVRLAHPVRDGQVGQVVGWTSFLDISPNDARVEIGSTAYDPRVWGSQVNPETKLLLLTHAFETLGMGRVQLKTDVRNHRSQRAIARLGATCEGVLRRYQRRGDGTVRDTVMFSITSQEWPAVKDRLISRLADR